MPPETCYRKTRISASCLFLMVTSLVTASASGLMVLALMTEHWEYVEFDRSRVAEVAANDTEVQWMLSGRVARLTFAASTEKSAMASLLSATEILSTSATELLLLAKGRTTSANKGQATQQHIRKTRGLKTAYLVPMHGGVWAICTNLKNSEREELAKLGYNHAWCKEYLSSEFVSEGESKDWMTRMQNLSISCAIVCLILLAASTLVGMLGVLKRQISAVLVTGVMYILAAVFCIFTLSIMQFKYRTTKDCGLVDTMVPKEYLRAQITTTGWSLTVGWLGISLCLLSSLLWYFLSKIMRYGPITLA